MPSTELESHELHREIGGILIEVASKKEGFRLLVDSACLPIDPEPSTNLARQHVPLFVSERKIAINRICDVDVLVINERIGDPIVSIVVEIEESGIGPAKVCGKLLTTGLAKYYMHDGETKKVKMSLNSILFIQILKRTKEMKAVGSKVEEKMVVLEKRVQAFVDESQTTIKEYHLLIGEKNDFSPGKETRIKFVRILEQWLDNQK
jgi:hypothetical protein